MKEEHCYYCTRWLNKNDVLVVEYETFSSQIIYFHKRCYREVMLWFKQTLRELDIPDEDNMLLLQRKDTKEGQVH